MDEAELKQRTKQFALRVIKLAGSLPGNFIARIIGSQLVRAGTSVGANYRAVCRARSQTEFIAKLGLDGTNYGSQTCCSRADSAPSDRSKRNFSHNIGFQTNS